MTGYEPALPLRVMTAHVEDTQSTLAAITNGRNIATSVGSPRAPQRTIYSASRRRHQLTTLPSSTSTQIVPSAPRRLGTSRHHREVEDEVLLLVGEAQLLGLVGAVLLGGEEALPLRLGEVVLRRREEVLPQRSGVELPPAVANLECDNILGVY
ncbi:hypothetical protein Daus18300_001488 [Diaporthe australafricana]|uniref:Uncharacterized protein n=1 Tax=Diaporthe australafricana TaxID=127596 RepID=A0ABR3XWR9_9PEZI